MYNEPTLEDLTTTLNTPDPASFVPYKLEEEHLLNYATFHMKPLSSEQQPSKPESNSPCDATPNTCEHGSQLNIVNPTTTAGISTQHPSKIAEHLFEFAATSCHS